MSEGVAGFEVIRDDAIGPGEFYLVQPEHVPEFLRRYKDAKRLESRRRLDQAVDKAVLARLTELVGERERELEMMAALAGSLPQGMMGTYGPWGEFIRWDLAESGTTRQPMSHDWSPS